MTRTPRNTVDAQFSVPWTVATALVKGKVSLEDFTDDTIKNEEILAVSREVSGHLDSGLTRHGVGPARLTVKMKSDEQFTEEVEHCLGSVERPMSFDDCVKKFRECSSLSRVPLSGAKVEKVIEMTSRLEEFDDATEVIRLFS